MGKANLIDKFEIAVVGLGAAGSATTYQLAKRGVRTVGFDQFSPPHSMGSSHGDTRITRQAIGEGEQFTPLSLRSYEIFREIERTTGKALLCITGGLMISGESSTGVHGVAEFFQNTLAAAKRYDINHEMLNTNDMRRRFPQFNVTDGDSAYFENNAGFLYAEECVRTQLELAEEKGAQIHRNEIVQSIVEEAEGAVVVTTSGGTYRAEKVVITAGPWITELFPELLELFKVERQVQYWFDIEPDYANFLSEKFPVFIWETPTGHSYGFPAIDGKEGGFKIGSSLFNKVITASTIDRQVTAAEANLMFEKQVRNFFPAATGRCVRTAVCMYTTTADAGFVIDKAPGRSSVFICSACSGHGFKHSAAVGESVAELVTTGRSSIDLSSFTLAKRRAAL